MMVRINEQVTRGLATPIYFTLFWGWAARTFRLTEICRRVVNEEFLGFFYIPGGLHRLAGEAVEMVTCHLRIPAIPSLHRRAPSRLAQHVYESGALVGPPPSLDVLGQMRRRPAQHEDELVVGLLLHRGKDCIEHADGPLVDGDAGGEFHSLGHRLSMRIEDPIT